MAALSPRLRWEKNVEACTDLVTAGHTTGVIRVNAVKALKVLNGDRSALRGPKVENFAAAILGEPCAVVLDTWMFQACGHHRIDATPKQYDLLAESLMWASEARGEQPRDMQAIIWTALRDG